MPVPNPPNKGMGCSRFIMEVRPLAAVRSTMSHEGLTGEEVQQLCCKGVGLI